MSLWGKAVQQREMGPTTKHQIWTKFGMFRKSDATGPLCFLATLGYGT